jgi:hypothetical protein
MLMDLKARHQLVDQVLERIRRDMHAMAEKAPDHWQIDEYEWLAAHVAAYITSARADLKVRRKSFDSTIRANRW